MGTSLNNVLGFDIAANVSNGNTSEQDANAALLELDKTLRSTKVGDQCEGIVRYARYLILDAETCSLPVSIHVSIQVKFRINQLQVIREISVSDSDQRGLLATGGRLHFGQQFSAPLYSQSSPAKPGKAWRDRQMTSLSFSVVHMTNT